MSTTPLKSSCLATRSLCQVFVIDAAVLWRNLYFIQLRLIFCLFNEPESYNTMIKSMQWYHNTILYIYKSITSEPVLVVRWWCGLLTDFLTWYYEKETKYILNSWVALGNLPWISCHTCGQDACKNAKQNSICCSIIDSNSWVFPKVNPTYWANWAN